MSGPNSIASSGLSSTDALLAFGEPLSRPEQDGLGVERAAALEVLDHVPRFPQPFAVGAAGRAGRAAGAVLADARDELGDQDAELGLVGSRPARRRHGR